MKHDYEPRAHYIYITREEAQRLAGKSLTWLDGIPVAGNLPSRGKPSLYRLSDVLEAINK